MPFLEWREEYEIGVGTIDEEHRRLFELLNTLYDAMKAGRGRDEIGGIIAELEAYVDYHFASETHLARGCGFSVDCASCHRAHQDAHEAFADQVAELRRLYEAGDATIHMKTLRFLREWTTEHIGEMDRQLGQYVHNEVDPDDLEPVEMTTSLETP